jgi:hypothetical protein
MKTNFLLIQVILVVSGCTSLPPLPKDSYIKGVHHKIVTPWGTAEQVIDEVSTGAAARNSSLPDGVAPAGARRISDLKPAAEGGVR